MTEPSGFQAKKEPMLGRGNIESQQTETIELIFTNLLPCIDYNKCIRDSNFWMLLSDIEQSNQCESLRCNMKRFFSCSTCKLKRGFQLICGCLICDTCENCNCHRDFTPEELKSKKSLECLKCFTIKPLPYFNLNPCTHFCNSCLGKEFLKGKKYCKICKAPYNQLNLDKKECSKCKGLFDFSHLVELSCFHNICVSCRKGNNGQKRNISKCNTECNKILETKDIYKITKGNLEKCMICLRMLEIDKFSRTRYNEIHGCIDVCGDCQEDRLRSQN
ncbi:hypothetical protein SteCoe_28725 [Stentor coeruleus]|uniref:RING-type domain-containing protein n=1 Tax=Stentor coeruleus TaxID=5963 RepID=A0A1R2B7V7_9CILI|nr:hypothetical protein SteCoe_28725 [Stentor coeruleus]